MAVYRYIRGQHREDGDRLFSEGHSDRTRNNGQKLQYGRSLLGTRRKQKITVRVVKHWNRFSSESVESQSLACSKLDRRGSWATWSNGTGFEQEAVEVWAPQASASLNCFVIQWIVCEYYPEVSVTASILLPKVHQPTCTKLVPVLY